MTLTAVADTGPLVHLRELDALSLLSAERETSPFVTDAVIERGDDMLDEQS